MTYITSANLIFLGNVNLGYSVSEQASHFTDDDSIEDQAFFAISFWVGISAMLLSSSHLFWIPAGIMFITLLVCAVDYLMRFIFRWRNKLKVAKPVVIPYTIS